jgi:hypothetical protein
MIRYMGSLTVVVWEDGGRKPSSCSIAELGMRFFAPKVIE